MPLGLCGLFRAACQVGGSYARVACAWDLEKRATVALYERLNLFHRLIVLHYLPKVVVSLEVEPILGSGIERSCQLHGHGC